MPKPAKATIGSIQYPNTLATLYIVNTPSVRLISDSRKYIRKTDIRDKPYTYPKCALFPERNRHTANAKQNAIGPAMSVSLSKKFASSALDCPWKGFRTAKVFSSILSG